MYSGWDRFHLFPFERKVPAMAIPRLTFLDILKDSYSAYYSIHDNPAELGTELPIAFRADYASRDERYWLTKSVKMWGNEKNEYAYVFAADSFTPEEAEACMEWAWEDGMPRVKPHGEHQCTNVKVIFIADAVSPETGPRAISSACTVTAICLPAS